MNLKKMQKRNKTVNNLDKLLQSNQTEPRKRKRQPSPEKESLTENENNELKVEVELIPTSAELCRVCLNIGCIPIYKENSSENLSEALKTFGDIDVRPDDNLPHSLCYDCHTLLRGAITLRETALESDQYLKNQEFKPNLEQSYMVCDNNQIEEQESKTDDFLSNFDQGNHNDTYSDAESNSDQDIDGNKEDYPCILCGLTFPKKRHLILHRRTTEHQNAVYKCPECHKEYGLRSYKDHIERHKATHKKQCDICGKLVPGNHLKRHRIIHTQEFPYECQLCPYKGRCSDALKGHMKSHSGDKPFQCPMCPVRCAKKFNLQQHMLTHKEGFDYQCDTCGKGYHTKKELEQHVRVGHAGVKEHVCSVCKKAFGYRKQLMQHQRNVHKRSKLPSGRTPLYLLLEETTKPVESQL